MKSVIINLPEEMVRHDQFVNWCLEDNPQNPSKRKKVPINPGNKKRASVTNPETWGSFTDALRVMKAGKADGVGFVFTKEDPFVGIDLDKCRDPESGKIETWAQKIVERFKSYTEISPSGTGVHIIVKGRLPGKGKKAHNIEMYDNGRFFTMTGNLLLGACRLIKARPKNILKLYESLSGTAEKSRLTNTLQVYHNDTEMDGILAKLHHDAREKLEKLMLGDTSDYPSPSEAELAFCSYVSSATKNPDVIDRLLRASKLMRPKWDEDHGGRTYGELTIAKALSNPRSSDSYARDEHATQYDIAVKTVEEIGPENIFSHAGIIWRWKQGEGLWKPAADEDIKKNVIRLTHQKKITTGFVNSVLGLIKSLVHLPEMPFTSSNKRIINCINGELHYENSSWILKNHNRDSMFCHSIPVHYDPDAKCKKFYQSLREMFAPDKDRKERIRLIQEFMGYALTTSCEFEKFLVLIGAGRNGKSVILSVTKALAGDKNVAGVQPSQLDNKFQLAHLHGKLLNIVTEIPVGAVINDAKVKAIVSGEHMTAEHKFGKPFDFSPYCTLILSANHLPHTKDYTTAFFRRAEVLKFNRVFEGHEVNVRLKDELLCELPGILNFALKGLARLYKSGFTVVPSSNAMKREWELAADQVAAFVADECEADRTAKTPVAELYRRYCNWAADNGIKSACNKPNLSSRLKVMGFSPGRGANGTRMIVGIRLSRQ